MENYYIRSPTREKDTEKNSRCFLPLPPDIRQVTQAQSRQEATFQVPDYLLDDSPSVETHTRQVQEVVQEILSDLNQGIDSQKKRNIEISSVNTTIIGDYVASVFGQSDRKWKVQSPGNATWASTLQGIKDKLISVDFRYVFFLLGHNQIRVSKRVDIVRIVFEVIAQVREINPEARIFICSILPRPVDNEEAKLLIVNFNRWISLAVNKAAKQFFRVHHIPIQHHFINAGVPKLFLFNQDQFTLNARGALLLKTKVFQLAGFKKNDPSG